MTEKIVVVDVDDVVCDLLGGAWLPRYNAIYDDTLTPESVTEWDMTKVVKPECGAKLYDILAEPDLYDQAPAIDGALAGVEAIRAMGTRVVFATNCGYSVETIKAGAPAKFAWLQWHGFLPTDQSAVKDFIVAADKSRLGDFLVDDRAATCDAFCGRAILFDQPHNRAAVYTHIPQPRRARSWPEVVRILRGYLAHGGFYLPAGSMTIIGLMGEMGSGKSTMARIFARELNFTPVALANGFKPQAVAQCGSPLGEVFGSVKSKETRTLLQQLGTERGRDVHGEDVWCKTLEAHLVYLHEHGVLRVVISDLRFENEADWVHALGGVVVKLVGRGGCGTGRSDAHRSEQDVARYTDADVEFDNGTIAGVEHAFASLSEQVARAILGKNYGASAPYCSSSTAWYPLAPHAELA